MNSENQLNSGKEIIEKIMKKYRNHFERIIEKLVAKK